MRNYGNHGHTVKASELTKLLPEDMREEYERLLGEGDWEGGTTFLWEHLPKQYPPPDLFLMCDEYESETLERGEVYACWDQKDLFVVTPKQEMMDLAAVGITPELNQWVTWG
jgi:hypothetical protein